jgi:hypothetical protein
MTTDESSNIAHDDRRTQSGSVAAVLPPSRAGSKNDDYDDKIKEEDVSSEEREFSEEGTLGAEDVEKATAAPVEKKNTKISVNNIASIPNGGIRAWMQVLGSFFIFFNTW